MPIPSVSPETQAVIVAEYHKGTTSAVELSHLFDLKPTTVRRILAEHKLISINYHKTKDEIELLEYLKTLGVSRADQIRGCVVIVGGVKP